MATGWSGQQMSGSMRDHIIAERPMSATNKQNVPNIEYEESWVQTKQERKTEHQNYQSALVKFPEKTRKKVKEIFNQFPANALNIYCNILT